MIEIDFGKKLLEWNRNDNKRTMPWKGETDPYRIWLSEIILQQTRVEQGLSYYNKFISRYPDVFSLANADEKDVFKSWEGLGYYSRCRNLIIAAKKIVKDFNGQFPSTYVNILELPGVGSYTAAAISSFAFNMPYAVVDGNVERVLSRYFGVSVPLGTNAAKKFYSTLATAILDNRNPGIYNQALMDFGATICKPRNPLCSICIQSRDCQAFQHNWTEQLPIKAEKIIRKIRWFNYLIVHDREGLWIRERNGKDIWKNLFEFFLFEPGQNKPHNTVEKSGVTKNMLSKHDLQIIHVSPLFTQLLTHQTIKGRFVHVKPGKLTTRPKDFLVVPFNKIKEYPFPKLISDYLKILSEPC